MVNAGLEWPKAQVAIPETKSVGNSFDLIILRWGRWTNRKWSLKGMERVKNIGQIHVELSG